MRDNSKMETLTAMVDIFKMMVDTILNFGKMMKKMDMERCFIPMGLLKKKDYGKMIYLLFEYFKIVLNTHQYKNATIFA
jgi:hypothetical protein